MFLYDALAFSWVKTKNATPGKAKTNLRPRSLLANNVVFTKKEGGACKDRLVSFWAPIKIALPEISVFDLLAI